jgi:serine/threonine protein kinase/predicted Zn-dependent protease
MECPKCHFENPADSGLCNKCGTQISSIEEVPRAATETIQIVIKELTPGSTFAKRYQIIEELGKGGMGRVYKVLDKEIGEKVALKLLNPEIAAESKTIERFRNELKTARQISHKNVCRMYHLSKEEGAPYIIMEYVRGEDLKSMIRMMGRLSPGQTVSIAKQVCEGLAEAHRLGVVHRDLKPQNIMIDRNGDVKIMDFGIARTLQAKGITGEGVMIGTPEYMSPEQAEGKEADERADIYALGIVLFEMLTGRVPFEGETPFSVALKHKTEIPPDPRKINSQVPDDLARLILRCLEKEKAKRFQSAQELLGEFIKIEKEIPTSEKALPINKSLTSKEMTVRFRKSWKTFAGLAAVAMVALLAVLYVAKQKPIPASAKKKLAVLPFENPGPPEDEYFADGITDEIIARLTGIGELGVIARNSSMQYKKTNKSIQQVSEELGVDYVLSGTIRWQKSSGGTGRVRVTPMLVSTADSTQIWADIYDQPIAEVFGVQSAISKEVVGALGAALLEPEKKSIEAKPTENMEAYDYYLRGNDFYYRGGESEEDTRLAIEMFEKAVALDSTFLQAYGQLAMMQARYYWYHYDRRETRIAKAKDALDRALQLGPDAPETNMALGYYYYWIMLDYEKALKHFVLAREKQPGNNTIIEGIGYVKRRQGKLDESVSYLKLAAELEPRSPMIPYGLGSTYNLLRNYREAERFYDRALFLNPHYNRAYAWKTRNYLNAEGNTQKARQVLEEAQRTLGRLDPDLIIYLWILADIFDGRLREALERLSSVSQEAFSDQFYFVPRALLSAQIYGLMNRPEFERSEYESARKFLEEIIGTDPDDSRFWSALGISYAGLGFREKAIQAAKKGTELMPISKEAYRGIFRARDLAQVYVMVGEYDKAFDQIEYLLSIPGELSVALLKLDPVWAPLRALPRFQKLIQK